MNARSIVQNCENYFSGFSDVSQVCSHKSPSQLGLGLLKIVSYLLVIPPIIFAALYFKNKKIIKIENDFDDLLDNNALKTQLVYQKNQPSKEHSQQEFISYLVEKVKEYQPITEEQRQKEEVGQYQPLDVSQERFQKGFRLLDFQLQGEFFKELVSQGAFEKLLKSDLIPLDTKELHIKLSDGSLSALRDYPGDNSFVNIRLLLRKLEDFKQLEYVHFDLRGLGFYGPELNQCLATNGQKGHFSSEPNTIKWHGATYSQWHRSDQLNGIIQQLREVSRKRPDLEYGLSFMNVGVTKRNQFPQGADNKRVGPEYGTNYGVGSVYRDEAPNFSVTLITYLRRMDSLH